MLTLLLSILLAASPNTGEPTAIADTVTQSSVGGNVNADVTVNNNPDEADYIFYVDNERVDKDIAKRIKLVDIKTITTVKGKAAIDLYGPDAINGVVDIKTKAGKKDSKLTLMTSSDKINHQYVDLGLSVKWATCNVGALKPEDFGDYYSWGEIGPKLGNTLTNYRFYKKGNSVNDAKFTKYCTNSDKGTVDKKTTLDPEDDVAHVVWGGSWRMPTKEEMDELRNNCTWTWFYEGNPEFGGVAGYKITSKKAGYKDRYIFLPAAGYRDITNNHNVRSNGYYLSRSLSKDSNNCASILFFTPGYNIGDIYYRHLGLSIRPVCP